LCSYGWAIPKRRIGTSFQICRFYLHKDTFGIGDYFLELPTLVDKNEQGVYCNRIDADPVQAIAALPEDVKKRAEGKPVESRDGGYAMSPGVFRGYAPIIIGAEDDPNREVFNSFVMYYLTPETATTSHYYWSITNDFNVESEEYYAGTKAFASIGFAEDKWASEHMQKLLDDDQVDYKEMVIAGDKAGMLYRTVMLDWVLEEYVG